MKWPAFLSKNIAQSHYCLYFDTYEGNDNHAHAWTLLGSVAQASWLWRIKKEKEKKYVFVSPWEDTNVKNKKGKKYVFVSPWDDAYAYHTIYLCLLEKILMRTKRNMRQY